MSRSSVDLIRSITNDLENNEYFKTYGDNALLLYSLTLRFNELDMSLASQYLTDGYNDKKIDLVFVNEDEEVAIIAQSYFSKDSSKSTAKANKASDLSSGIQWLLCSKLDGLPTNLQVAAEQLREGIKNQKIRRLEIWYVHNLSESNNVKIELDMVAKGASSILKSNFSDQLNIIQINALEVGQTRLARWYKEKHDNIYVDQEFDIEVSGGFETEGPNEKWKSFMTTVPLNFLYKLYDNHHDSLFSANVREYLGSRKGKGNINSGIKESVSKKADDFLIYNNGITFLTNDYQYDKEKKKLKLRGISIINGAQTTGAIGSIEKEPSKGNIFTRIVKINDTDVLNNVIEYNNRQNAMNPADFRSNDQIQKKLRKEFNDCSIADYAGGRRGGNGDAIKRNAKQLDNNLVAQILASFMGRPTDAYQSSKNIWENNNIYDSIFNESTNSSNIIFTYTLYMAIKNIKKEYMEKKTAHKEEKNFGLSDSDFKILEFLQVRGFYWITIAAMSSILQDILDVNGLNKQSIRFKQISSLEDGVKLWEPLVRSALPLFNNLFMGVLRNGLKNRNDTNQAVLNFANQFKVILSFSDKGSNNIQPFIDRTEAK